MTAEQIMILETARQNVYKGFSSCFYLPDDTLPKAIDALACGLSVLESSALGPVSRMQEIIMQTYDIETLKVDFSKLFIGPYSLPCPPFGSIWLEGKRKVMGESTQDVKARYERFGLCISPHFNNVPDHVAAELEFMFFLIHSEVDLIGADCPDQIVPFLNEQSSFLRYHLNNWIPDFSSAIRENAGTDFYKHLAGAIEAFIAEDIEYIGVIQMPETLN